jgi:prevent-host-death family protein
MNLVTISEAKAKLSALVDLAERGGQVLIMRGSKPAVALVPVSEEDLIYQPQIPSSALAEFEKEIEADQASGKLELLGTTPDEAAKSLRRK